VLQKHKFPRKNFCYKISNPTLPKPFLQNYGKPQTLIYQQKSTTLSTGAYRTIISAKAGRQSWDFGRFIKTLYFFNGPPSPAKVTFYFLFFLIMLNWYNSMNNREQEKHWYGSTNEYLSFLNCEVL